MDIDENVLRAIDVLSMTNVELEHATKTIYASADKQIRTYFTFTLRYLMKARYSKYLLGTTLLILSGLSSGSALAASCGPANNTSIIAMPIAIPSLCTAPATPQCTNSA